MRRLLASLNAALLGYCVGSALGVPIWSQWKPGDRSDLAFLSFMTVWLLTSPAASAIPAGKRASSVDAGKLRDSTR